MRDFQGTGLGRLQNKRPTVSQRVTAILCAWTKVDDWDKPGRMLREDECGKLRREPVTGQICTAMLAV